MRCAMRFRHQFHPRACPQFGHAGIRNGHNLCLKARFAGVIPEEQPPCRDALNDPAELVRSAERAKGRNAMIVCLERFASIENATRRRVTGVILHSLIAHGDQYLDERCGTSAHRSVVCHRSSRLCTAATRRELTGIDRSTSFIRRLHRPPRIGPLNHQPLGVRVKIRSGLTAT